MVVQSPRNCFEDLFSYKIKQLLHNYPLNRLTESGTPFWSGAKKPPAPLVFDSSDPLHVEFVSAAALMCCRMYRISLPEHMDRTVIADIAGKVDIPEFRWAVPSV